MWFFISLLGDPWIWIFVIMALILLYRVKKEKPEIRKIKRILYVMVPSFFITLVLIQALKFAIFIPRPCVVCPWAACNPFCSSDSSFPSGHAAIAFSMFTSMFLASGKKRDLIIFIIPVLVSISRIMLGVHVLVDILGGFALGVLVPVLWFKLFKSAWFFD